MRLVGPGSGKYNLRTKPGEEARRYTIGSKAGPKEPPIGDGVGVGRYSPEYGVGIGTGRKSQIRDRIKEKAPEKGPGFNQAPLSDRGPKWTIGRREELLLAVGDMLVD
jgi:hypothetical protein